MSLVGTSAPWQNVNMPAVDLRRMLAAAIVAEGVQDAVALQVSQRGAGANMSVDVAAGKAYVKDDHAGANAGGFYWADNDAVVNVAITTADATNPRIDRVILEVRDAFLGDASNDWRLRVLAGTPTAGANLTNLTGAAAVPSNAILLANVLVGAAVSAITNANIDTGVRPRLALAGSTATYFSTLVEVINTVTETPIFSHTIPAGAVGLGQEVRLTIHGEGSRATAGGQPTIRVKLGGTTTMTFTPTFTQTDTDHYTLEARIARYASSSQKWYGLFAHAASPGSVVRIEKLPAASSIDMAQAQALTVTVQWSAADSSFRFRQGLLRIV